MSKTVLIAMSGGVDSAVAAYMIKRQGFDCAGATIKFFDNESAGAGCAQTGADDARQVAEALGIPFYVLDFTCEFKAQVIERFVDAYQRGATPNPCVYCNRHIKFEMLLRYAKQMGMDYIATGHYAKTGHDAAAGRYILKKGADGSKDQSYVLYGLTQEQLAHTLFPLGGFRKEEIREIAAAQGFINAGKRDSQDICFVQDGDYAGFIERYTGQACESGHFIDTQGNILGRHKGLIRYTVGQRKGLGLSFPQPMYVLSKNTADNTITLCENEALFSKEVNTTDFNWIACDKPTAPIRAKAKIRYNQQAQWATAAQTGEDTVRITFDEPQRAIAKGQAAVLYDGDIVVGGGTIV